MKLAEHGKDISYYLIINMVNDSNHIYIKVHYNLSIALHTGFIMYTSNFYSNVQNLKHQDLQTAQL